MLFTNRSRWSYRSFLALLLLGGVALTACVEARLQPGVYACKADSDCPPGGFFCDNYFNSYIYNYDVAAHPVGQNYWGVCLSSWKGQAVEGCTNGLDDDADGKIDCHDMDCQTAPVCSAAVKACGTAGSELQCDELLSFPVIRRPLGTEVVDGTTCPLIAGFYDTDDGTSVFTGSTLASLDQLCLPRCRLHFPPGKPGDPPNTDDDFVGSDLYCNDTVHDSFMTEGFESRERICVHLNMKPNLYGINPKPMIQNDICIPKPTEEELSMDSCDDCADPSRCLVVTVEDRNQYFTVETSKPPIEFYGEQTEPITTTLHICL